MLNNNLPSSPKCVSSCTNTHKKRTWCSVKYSPTRAQVQSPGKWAFTHSAECSAAFQAKSSVVPTLHLTLAKKKTHQTIICKQILLSVTNLKIMFSPFDKFDSCSRIYFFPPLFSPSFFPTFNLTDAFILFWVFLFLLLSSVAASGGERGEA